MNYEVLEYMRSTTSIFIKDTSNEKQAQANNTSDMYQ